MKLIACAVALTSVVLVTVACKKQDETQPPVAPTAQQPYAQPYPTATQPYPQPYPTATQPYPTATQPYPTAAPTAAPMATPGPLALPCQNDSTCGTFRCNVQFQKCAMPCQSEADCITGSQCAMGMCIPKMGQ
jgi:hypothetical protein